MSIDALNLMELEAQAGTRLAEMAWDYYRSGADDEVTLRRNREAFAELALCYRVLVDVSRRDLSTRVLDAELALPIMLAPTAFHRLAHPDGELASVRAAGEAGTVMVLSTLSTTPVEEVVAAASGDVWFQLYVYRDREATRALVERVRTAGCKALVLTVDAPMLGRRERDVRNAFALPAGIGVQNMLASGYAEVDRHEGESGLAAYFARLIDPTLSWPDLDWLRNIAEMPVLVKGVVRADDARRALQHGADGVIVSNHGGRQLDGSIATVEALPAIADAVGDAAPVLCDGGIRRGTDVLKALALGARAVLIGRPQLWGLSVEGQAGVTHVLSMLRDELDRAMALSGCPDLAAVTRDLIAPRSR